MNKKMTKNEFMKKHAMTEQDYRNLLRYEEVRADGGMNMFEYLYLMKTHNMNGGSELADWICSGNNYGDFREVLENEKL